MSQAPACSRCGQHRDAAIHLPLFKDPWGHVYSEARVKAKFHMIREEDNYSDANDEKDYDPERVKAYRAGQWHFIGIRAKAVIDVIRQGYTTQYEFESAGLWGIESDSDESYLQEVFREECHQLKSDIEAIATGPIEWEDK